MNLTTISPQKPVHLSLYLRIIAIIMIVGIGFGLRFYYATNSPEAHDEDDYLSAARAFREAFETKGVSALPDVDTNTEHPPLVKLLYSLTLDADELEDIPAIVERSSRNPLPENSLHNARWQSVAAGTLTLLAVAITDPVGAAMLSIQTIHVQFSSVAYLDALPTLFTALLVFFYTRSLNNANAKRQWLYLGLSAICLGIATAAKYPFSIIGFVVLAHALRYRLHPLKVMMVWGVIAVVVFFLFNPYLWQSPLERLWDQTTYHKTYADNQVPTYSPLKPYEQLLTPNDYLPPLMQSPLWILSEGVLFFLMIPGVIILIRQRSVYGWWLIFGMLFLMVYPSQWIQHKMLVVVPYSVSASAGLKLFWEVGATQYHRTRIGFQEERSESVN